VILVNEPVLNGNEKKYLNECIDTGWISSEGPFVKTFESQMATYLGRRFATACSSGTAALDIAIAALGLKEGDEVIMPSFTIISCAQALTRLGVKPVVIDCDYSTFNIRVSDIEAVITKKTKAIMAVHIFGLTVDMDPLLDVAKKYNLKVIEDAAEVIGQDYKGKKCGSFGDVSILSFYPNKHITTGEGGMVLCNDVYLDQAAKKLRNLFFGSKRFVHDEIGFNYRMTNMQAALGVAQLENIQQVVLKKRLIGEMYDDLLGDLNMINLPIKATSYCENIYWVYAITIKDDYGATGQEMIDKLAAEGIGARPFFYPMHQQPVFKRMGLFKNLNLPNSEKLYKKGFYIPSGLALSQHQADEVSSVLHNIL
jgi:perosamine synthetase